MTDEQFESWWEMFGCRVVVDPKDYAREAWRECARRSEPNTESVEIGSESVQ